MLRLCLEHTGILPKYVIVNNIKKKFFPFNFRALRVGTDVCVTTLSMDVRYLHQYLPSYSLLFFRIF